MGAARDVARDWLQKTQSVRFFFRCKVFNGY